MTHASRDASKRVVGVEGWNAQTRPASVIVIIPTYNERENIIRLLPALAALESGVDILIADDGSPDGTAEAVSEIAPTLPGRTFLMRRAGKFGLGVCYLDAFDWVRAHMPEYRVIVQMDADFSHDPSMISLLAEQARAYGVSVGSRYVEGGSTPDWNRHRIFLSKGGNIYARTVLRLFRPGYPVRDNTSGFIAWRTDVLDDVLKEQIPGDGYAFLTSLKFLAFLKGHPAIEVPIAFRDRRLGVSKLDRNIILEAVAMPWRLGWAGRLASTSS